MIGEETCCSATRAMLAYARALMRGDDTPRLGQEGLGAADRIFVVNRRPDDSLPAVGGGLDALFAPHDQAVDLGRLFGPPERRLVLALLDAVATSGDPGVIRAHGQAFDGSRVDVELMLGGLPAFWSRGDRFLGHAIALGDQPKLLTGRLTIGALLTPEAPRPKPKPQLRLVVSNP